MAALNCWNCDSTIEVPLPLSRRETCPSCNADLRCCRMCEFHDRNYARDCREPDADAVSDKERSNMCDFFRPASRGGVGGGESTEARKKLERLFGGDGETGTTSGGPGESEAEAARRKLDEMFKKD